MNPIDELVDLFARIKLLGLENAMQSYYGIYRAEVVSNEDPEERGRVQLRVVDLGQLTNLAQWVPPLFDAAGNSKGSFFPPEKGDFVRVFFNAGDPSQMMGYLGGWYGTEDKVSEFAYTNARPEKRGFISRLGSGYIISDEAGNQYFRVLWHQPDPGDEALSDASVTADRTTGKTSYIDIGPDGSITAQTHDGHTINMSSDNKALMILHKDGHGISLTEKGIQITDKDGNLISINDGDVSIVTKKSVKVMASDVQIASGGVSLGQGATMSAVLGEPFMATYATHTHVAPPGGGPTGPALPPPTPNLLSQSVKLKP